MRIWQRLFVVAIVAASVATAVAQAADSGDGQAAFKLREETMKGMGRALYTAVGRVVRGKAELSPDTIIAAETIATNSGKLASLFPTGSDVPDSRMKPEIFAAPAKVDELVHGVQQAADRLVPAVKSGDKTTLAAAYAAVDGACEACHREYRKSPE